MSLRFRIILSLTTVAVLLVPASNSLRGQEKAQTGKAFRCMFPLIATGTWKTDGEPNAVLKPSKLILRFESINVDEGTAELKNGTVSTGVTLQSAGGNLHFVQAFRSGPLYLTTIFNKEIQPG